MAQILSDPLFGEYFHKMIQAEPKELMRTDVMEYDWMTQHMQADELMDFIRQVEESNITRQRNAGFRMRLSEQFRVGK